VLSDVSGPVPGLFQSTVQAVNSWAGMINSQGGIFGRKIKVDVIDSKTDAGANRAGALQACDQDFALVGSMSAYDDGGAGPIDQCGIPDLTAIPTNAPRGNEKNGFFAFPNVQQWYALGPKKYIADTFPQAPKAAAMIWLNANVTRSNAQKNMEAGSSIGYQWVYQKQVEITEPNYAPYVVDMKNRNVQYVSMVGDANNESRLLQAMAQQNFKPQVREFDSVVYDPRFLAAAGSSADGIIFALNIVPLEEASTSQEAQLYQQWLKKTAGSAKPDYFGVYAWSAARMFQQALEQVGAQLTRAALISNLKNLHSWDDHGMHAAQDVGGKKPTPCFLFMTVANGAFKRSHPSSGFDCNRAPDYAVKSAG
jgi:ABC-type branched-subunit amino acid transport system substrate-binding protein